MTAAINQLGRLFLAAFIFVALVLGYWGLVRRDDLLARQDNPRLLLEEQKLQRGQILDRNGVVLAETQIDSTTGLGTRRYPEPAVAPIVGYYSLRHGVGGIEAAYDDVLRGDAFLTPAQNLANHMLHRPQVGGDVRLTIDLRTQQIADQALAGSIGTVIVLKAPQGDVLAIGSQPSFNPNQLDDLWDSLKSDPNAPLLNRATQSLFQPGTILQSIVLGTAINVGAASPDDTWDSNLTVRLEGVDLPCAEQPPAAVSSLQDAFVWACPRPFQALGERLGTHTLDIALDNFGLLEAPAFELPTAVPSLDMESTLQDPALASIGQGNLTVSALQMGLVAAAFADHGQMPAPRLVQAIHAPDDPWNPTPLRGNPRGTISRGSADQIIRLMADAARIGSARAARQAEDTMYGQVGLALSGPQASLNSWFIGFAYLADGDAISVAVLLENSRNTDDAARIGGSVLHAAIESLD
jgi:penicillin-binding protein A